MKALRFAVALGAVMCAGGALANPREPVVTFTARDHAGQGILLDANYSGRKIVADTAKGPIFIRLADPKALGAGFSVSVIKVGKPRTLVTVAYGDKPEQTALLLLEGNSATFLVVPDHKGELRTISVVGQQ